jgi:hypothetical protein
VSCRTVLDVGDLLGDFADDLAAPALRLLEVVTLGRQVRPPAAAEAHAHEAFVSPEAGERTASRRIDTTHFLKVSEKSRFMDVHRFSSDCAFSSLRAMVAAVAAAASDARAKAAAAAAGRVHQVQKSSSATVSE